MSGALVVGGGVSGLATAYYLRGEDVVVLEASGRLGGKLHTIEVGGLPVEAGADSFVVRKPWATELCSDLGLEEEVVIPGAFGAFVAAGRRLVPFPERVAFGIPASAMELLRWPGLAIGPRFRALADLVRPPGRAGGDESLGALLRRRLGGGASRVLVEPLLAGLHAGDPMALSVAATFPEIAQWERRHGSLMRGARQAVKAADRPGEGRKPMFATVWGGLSRMIEALAAALGEGAVRLDAPVSRLLRARRGYRVETSDQVFEPEAVILATPAFESARLLRDVNPAAAAEIGEIRSASTAVVALVYPPGTADRLPIDGTGYVVPAGEGVVTACTWVSRKWPSDQMGDRAVLRCFVGRAGSEEALELSDETLGERVKAEVEAVTPLGAPPEAVRVVRWERSMPQYGVGHLDLLDRAERALEETPGLFVTGSAYRGVGIADCVRQARETAERARAFLEGTRPEPIEQREAPTWTT